MFRKEENGRRVYWFSRRCKIYIYINIFLFNKTTAVVMSLTCRVQYLNDVDPFAYASSYPEPARPPVHTFSATLPLINQLAAVHRLLRAPHRVSQTLFESANTRTQRQDRRISEKAMSTLISFHNFN